MAAASIVTIKDVLVSWSELQIVDARSRDEYRAGHLPGAVHMDWRDFRATKTTLVERLVGVRTGLVSTDERKLATQLSGLGLREDLPILVYGGESRWGEEGRIAWNLLYWGAKDVRLLDGGWRAWTAARPQVPRSVHAKKTFSVRLVPERRSDFLATRTASTQKKMLVDVRTESEVRAGKIPHSRHLLDARLYRADGTFPERDELAALLPNIAEAEAFYCAGGVRSALAAVLVEARFGSIVRNYDGSMWDWEENTRR